MNRLTNFFSSDSDEVRPSNYFQKHQTVLKVTGISLDEKDTVLYKVYSAILFIILTSYICLSVLDIFVTSYEDAVNMMAYHVGFGIALIKMTIFRMNQKRMGGILKKLEQKPFIVNYKRCGIVEKKYLDQFFTIHILQTTFYWTSLIVMCSINFIYALIIRIYNNNPEYWHLPYGKLAVINTNYTPAYELCLLYQNFSTSIFFMNYTTSDLIITGVLCNASYQFKILQHYLKNIVNDKRFKTSGSVAIISNFLKERIREAVAYHLAIMSLIQEIEELFNKLILYVFLTNFVVLGSAFYRTAFISLDDPRIVKRVLEFGVVLFQLFILAFWGEKIISESIAVGDAAYQANFVGHKLSFQSSLQLIVLRSQTPVELTVGKFSNLRLTTFVWIIRTSYSIFMVLRSGHVN